MPAQVVELPRASPSQVQPVELESGLETVKNFYESGSCSELLVFAEGKHR